MYSLTLIGFAMSMAIHRGQCFVDVSRWAMMCRTTAPEAAEWTGTYIGVRVSVEFVHVQRITISQSTNRYVTLYMQAIRGTH